MYCSISFLKQLWTVSAILIVSIGQGMVFGLTGVLLPALAEPVSPIKLDLASASWLASSVGIASFGGFILSSLSMDYLGRRKSFFLAIVPGLIGWTLIYLSEDFVTLLIGRSLSGVTTGAVLILGAIIIGEYTAPEHRGMFLSLKSACICLGTTLVHGIGSTLHWKTTAIIALIAHIISLIIVCTWPESPPWLMWKNQFDKSEKAFKWLRGHDMKAKREFQELIKARNERDSVNSSSTENSLLSSIIRILKKNTRKDFFQPIVITFFVCMLLETSGRHYFQAYVMEFANVITENKIDSVYYILTLDIIITASALFSSFLMKTMKRKTLLLSSGFAALIVLIFAATYLFLISNGVLSNNYPWIPITLFILFFILTNLGCSPIPLTIIGEIFPIAHRNVGSAVAGVIMSGTLTGTLKVTPYLLVGVKVHGTLAIFGLIMCVSLLTLYFILPETKDRTLQEIEHYFNHGSFKDKEDSNIMMLNKDVM